MKTALVLGSGGFIGSHLVKRLKKEGYWVRGVDLKRPEYGPTEADQFVVGDLRDLEITQSALRIDTIDDVKLTFSKLPHPFSIAEQFDEVYQLAADMGGAGFVFTGENDADIMHNSAQINLNVLDSLKNFKGKIFYSSSACMYPQEIQSDVYNKGLKEDDAYPGNPDSEYGWEKLFSERLYFAYARNKGIDVRVARFHNIYGPEGTYQGGREKAPAAMCRKAILSKEDLRVWGPGIQTRSFLFIEDCLDAVRLFMQSDFQGPINIGSEEMVTINQLAQMAIDFSGKDLKIVHESGPVGVMGRNSDNTLIREKLGWEPKYSLKEGLKITFDWIKSRYDVAI